MAVTLLSSVGRFLLIAMLGATSTSAQLQEQDLRIDFQKHYYPVSGSNWSQIRQSIENSRISIGGTREKFEGVTEFSLALRPARGCTAANSTVEMKLVVRVPGLPRETRLGPGGRECWAHYDRSLADHEEWHVQIAVHDARELIAAVRASSGISCDGLQDLARVHFTRMKSAQSDYDAVTSHGLEQWKAFQLSEDPDVERRAVSQLCASRSEHF